MDRAAIRALNLTAETVQEHLLWDEYFLQACDAGELGPTLRFWKVRQPAVVLGFSCKTESEVNVEACRDAGVPIVRRTTGGGTVLLDAGCLNYSLVLPITFDAALNTVCGTNQFIMQRHRDALTALTGQKVDLEGDTDLAMEGCKISGNAQRRLRGAILFHGTFLCQINHSLMDQLLPFPSRQPGYRCGRKHIHFLRNLDFREIVIRQAIQSCWTCNGNQPLDVNVNEQLLCRARERLLRGFARI